MNGKDYNKKEIVVGQGYELVKLGEIAKLENGKQLDKKNIIDGIYPVYGGGLKPIGSHNEYNQENCTIIAGTGHCGFVQFDKNKFWASQCFTIKSENELINKYLFVICKSIENIFMNSCSGSVQKFIRASQFNNMLIPIPKSKEKITEWVNKISKPYTKKNESEKLIMKLEEEIKNKIKIIGDNEECDEYNFNDVCDTKKGKQLSKENFKTGNIPVIGGGISPTGYHNEYNMPENTILCSSSGNNAGFISKYNSKVWASDCFAIISKNITITNDYLYYLLKIKQDEIFNYQNGSAQPHIYSTDLNKHIKIKLPKNKQLIKDFDPLFQQIETLQTELKEAETQYKQFIKELSEEAIPPNKQVVSLTKTNLVNMEQEDVEENTPSETSSTSSTMSIKSLHAQCKLLKIKGYTKYKKKEDKEKLLQLIQEHNKD